MTSKLYRKFHLSSHQQFINITRRFTRASLGHYELFRGKVHQTLPSGILDPSGRRKLRAYWLKSRIISWRNYAVYFEILACVISNKLSRLQCQFSRGYTRVRHNAAGRKRLRISGKSWISHQRSGQLGLPFCRTMSRPRYRIFCPRIEKGLLPSRSFC